MASPIDSLFAFFSEYGVLWFNERFELDHFDGREEHKEAAMQDWFAFLRRRLAEPEKAGPTICPGCGEECC